MPLWTSVISNLTVDNMRKVSPVVTNQQRTVNYLLILPWLSTERRYQPFSSLFRFTHDIALRPLWSAVYTQQASLTHCLRLAPQQTADRVKLFFPLHGAARRDLTQFLSIRFWIPGIFSLVVALIDQRIVAWATWGILHKLSIFKLPSYHQ